MMLLTVSFLGPWGSAIELGHGMGVRGIKTSKTTDLDHLTSRIECALIKYSLI